MSNEELVWQLLKQGDYEVYHRDILLYGCSFWKRYDGSDELVHVPVQCCKPLPSWVDPDVIEIRP